MKHRLYSFLPALLLLAACGKHAQPEAGPGKPPQAAGPAPAVPAFKFAGVDATRLGLARVIRASAWPPLEFPWAVEFQDPRVLVKVASPDGRRLVWRGQDGQGYWLFLSDRRRGPRRLDACHNGYQPVWSPDSRRILYSAMDWRRRERALYVYTPGSGKKPLRVFNADQGLGALAAWSPDGNKIVFTYHGDGWIMNSNGIGMALLDVKNRGGGPLGEAERIAWSRDGASLAYQTRGKAGTMILTLFARP